jgi:hypothetical protein
MFWRSKVESINESRFWNLNDLENKFFNNFEIIQNINI